MKRKLGIIAIVIALVGGAVGIGWVYFRLNPAAWDEFVAEMQGETAGSAAPRPIKRPAGKSGALTASGTIEAEELTVAAEIGGRIVEMWVGEGDEVAEGDVLLRLDSTLLLAQREQAEAAVAQAQAALDAAQAQLALAQAGARPEEIAAAESAVAAAEAGLSGAQAQRQAADGQLAIAQAGLAAAKGQRLAAEAALAIAEAQVGAAQANLDSAEAQSDAAQDALDALKKAGVTAGAGFDEAQLAVDLAQAAHDAAEAQLVQAQAGVDAAQAGLTTAQANVDAATAGVATAQAGVTGAQAGVDAAQAQRDQVQAALDVVKAGARDQEIALLEANVAQAQAAMAGAKAALKVLDAQLARATLTAPLSGVVVERLAHAGELAAPGAPLLTLANLSEATLTVYVPEADLGRVSLGQAVEVTVDAYEDVFSGRVSHVASRAEFTPKNVQTQAERVHMVFAVKVQLDNADGRLKPGMPADAVFE
jgi:HlyD family secretion protein